MKKIYFFVLCLICMSLATPAQQKIDFKDTAENTFTTVEVEATFPGGLIQWRTYLEKNLKASIPVKMKAPAGTYTVVVKFIVDKQGNISNVNAETKFGYGMENEVIRVIKKGPHWKPAMQNGKVVKAFRRQPVTFVISEE